MPRRVSSTAPLDPDNIGGKWTASKRKVHVTGRNTKDGTTPDDTRNRVFLGATGIVQKRKTPEFPGILEYLVL
jgi:hypothetical protein